MSKLIVGCGYLGKRVADVWRNQGNSVFTVTRSEKRAEELAAEGFQPIVADITDPKSFPRLPKVETVLFAVGFDRAAGKSIREVYVDGLSHTLQAVDRMAATRFIYISSTGVYGQDGGEWVDEDSLCQPTREGGRACLAAEQLLMKHPLGKKAIILRLGGIYGPQRIPRLLAIANNVPINVDDGYLNLIHVEDAANTVLAVETLNPPLTLLVTDGNPVRRKDFYRYAGEVLGKEVRFEDRPDETERRGGRGKRCRTDRLKKLVQIPWIYPDYKQGLSAIARHMTVEGNAVDS